MITWLIVIASILHLSVYGLLPSYGYRYLGDAILFAALLIALSKKHLLVPNRETRMQYIGIAGFLLFVLFLIIYTILLWQNELFLTLRYSRRWLIFGVYMFLLYSRISTALNWKIIRNTLVFGALVSAVSIILEKDFGIDFPGIDTLIMYQGGILVEKTFNPVNFLIVTGLVICLFEYLLLKKPMLRLGLLSLVFISFFSIINFRFWWIALLVSLIISSTITLIRLGIFWKRTLVLFVIGSMIATILFGLNQGQYILHRIDWLISVFSDITQVSGTWEYRARRDVNKVFELWNTKNVIYITMGAGFLGQGSIGEKSLGFYTGSTDVGLVEVFLTGGCTGLIFIGIVYLMVLFRAFRLVQMAPNSPYTRAWLALWVMAGLLMVSSNLLLWDFGFVPLSLVGFIANSQIFLRRIDK